MLIQDEKLQYALIRLIEIVGEAASHITDDFQTQHPDIPWAQMIGMRNRIIHAYFEINLNVVWVTLTDNLPTLIQQLESLISTLENSPSTDE
jgi:uncharacterized protein with HEPN domain